MAELMHTRQVREPVRKINTPEGLTALATELGVRPDWHEPDEQDVTASTYGYQLDNAMGAGWVSDSGIERSELNVIIAKNAVPVAVVNLATLLSWGAEYGRLR